MKPWEPLGKIERALFPDEKDLYFTEKRFHKRDDGYYCLIKDLNLPTIGPNLLCLSKRGKSKKEVIPDDIRQKLEEFFYPINRQAGVDFSWLK